ncbi:flavin reductase family protein [Bradyrhizobium mercantei]|uniref:flavin reductase family protein n=1 Tax=Bradyrhizobium mercantei TaxID=1904807 RepID=UPI0009FA340A|nr:flavin reductase family protein [Bradyrhizobium mercantei]
MNAPSNLLSSASRTAAPPYAGVDPASYRAAMRHHAGAVTILTAGGPGDRTGMTATSVCSLSDTPPRLIACVNRSASAHGLIRRTAAFGVNMLHADQAELANVFAGRRGIERDDRFGDGDGWLSLATGAPILKAALIGLDCELIDEHAHDTHSIFVGAVRAMHLREGEAPLVYFGGAFRALAPVR